MPGNKLNTQVHQEATSVFVRDVTLPDGSVHDLEETFMPQFAQVLSNRGEAIQTTLDDGTELNDFFLTTDSYRALLGVPAHRAKLSLITSTENNVVDFHEGLVELTNRQNDITSQLLISSPQEEWEFGLSQVHADGRPAQYQPTDADGRAEPLPLDAEIASDLLTELLIQAGHTKDTIGKDPFEKLRTLIDASNRSQLTQRALYTWSPEDDVDMSARLQRIVRTIYAVGPAALTLSEIEIDIRSASKLPHNGGTLLTGLAFAAGNLTRQPYARLSAGIIKTSTDILPIAERQEMFKGLEKAMCTPVGLKRQIGRVTQLLGSPKVDDPEVTRLPYDSPLELG